MISISILTGFNLLVLLNPPKPIKKILELKLLPPDGRIWLLILVILNAALSVSFEQWGALSIARFIGKMQRLRKDRRRERVGKVYKHVEGGMR